MAAARRDVLLYCDIAVGRGINPLIPKYNGGAVSLIIKVETKSGKYVRPGN